MNIAVIENRPTDFGNLFSHCKNVSFMSFDEAEKAELSAFDSFCILGGTETEPVLMSIDLRNKLEAERAAGKRFFCEYLHSFSETYFAPAADTVFERLVYCAGDVSGLSTGELLDDHANSFSYTYYRTAASRPVLYYGGRVTEHDKTEVSSALLSDPAKWALWYYDDNCVISCFRLCDFIKARFAPFERWKKIIEYLFYFIAGDGEKMPMLSPMYRFEAATDNLPAMVRRSVKRAVEWFGTNELFIDGGESGILEGYSHHIYPDGVQRVSREVRNDCAGETAGVYLFDGLLNNKKESLATADRLSRFNYGKMQVKDGFLKGMMRWTTAAYGVCYQDDAARTVLGRLLYMNITENRDFLNEICDSCDFLVRTTCKDGLRPFRTDNIDLTPEGIENMRTAEAKHCSAHYNAYYHAVLLLCYRLCAKKEYLEVAEKGLSSIMAVFPDTAREQSETEELCRLIFPLACLYGVTKNEQHKIWLYDVADRLKKYRHPFGGYREWDTGYKAACSRNANGECSLLANNGDPVCDMLYSVNWLGLGFAEAYKATGDRRFAECWRSIAAFYVKTQIISENKTINGAWARGFDMDKADIYGVPHDVGWGPWCIETGWTVAETVMGLQYGMLLKIDEQKD